MDHHDIEISNFAEMLKYVTLSKEQLQKLDDLTGGEYPTGLMDSMRMWSSMMAEGMNDLDLSSELNYVSELLMKYSDDEVIKLCDRQTFLNEILSDIVVDGKPNREKIAEAYLDIIMEDGGLSITDFDGFYEGDFEQFKEYVQTDIAQMFEADE